MQRFNQIHYIYQKTNLIYDINIEVFQAKINRLKYLYGEDKAGDTMTDYVTHAQQLTQQAQQLPWTADARGLLNDVASHLARFQHSITAMTQQPNSSTSCAASWMR